MERYPYKKTIRDPRLHNAMDLNERRKAKQAQSGEARRPLRLRLGNTALALTVLGGGIAVAGAAASRTEAKSEPHTYKVKADIDSTLWEIADDMSSKEEVDLRPLVDELAEQRGTSIVQPFEELEFQVTPEMAAKYGIETTPETSVQK